jgi:DNA modification methylase
MPELVWEGKYDAQGRRRGPQWPVPAPTLVWTERHVPLQPDLLGAAPSDAPWRNRLILGDNLLVMAALRDELRAQVQLVYIDPPFDAGADFQLTVSAPGEARRRGLAYRDLWEGEDTSYLQFMYERLVLLHELLADTGCLCLHCDWRSHAPLRLMLDEVFGRARFINEIVWHYYNKYSAGKDCLPRAHDTLLLYGKTSRARITPPRLPRAEPRRQLKRRSVDGVLKNARDESGRLMYQWVTDKKADDVWDLPQLQPASAEWTGFGTQKHHDLLARVVEMASGPGDLVLDVFCGSGTTLVAADRLGRRWLGCDVGLPALHTSRKRLLRGAAGFDVLTLGGAEPALWAERIAGDFPRGFRDFVLARLGASPEAEPDWRHGRLEGAAVHVAPPGAAVAGAAARALVRAAQAGGAARLVLVAWDFEPGFWAAAGPGGGLLPVLLPREWLRPGNPAQVPPRVLPRLAANVERNGAGSATVRLGAFHAPTLAEVPAGEWEPERWKPALVDGWAAQAGWLPGTPFQPDWSDFRAHRRPHVQVSATLTPPAECRRVLVKAWDPFGTEGSVVIEL